MRVWSFEVWSSEFRELEEGKGGRIEEGKDGRVEGRY
jgi:hypothetical protein